MTDEEIGRFASVLEGCGGIRKMMVRDEATLSDAPASRTRR
jgi:hypothetical protein